MKLKSRDTTKPGIHVLTVDKKIVLKNGFAILTKETHAGFETVRKDALISLYEVKENQFKD